MATFMTRIELHDAQYQDYVNLHTHMDREGFTNTITSGDGTTYKLPPAEYLSIGTQKGPPIGVQKGPLWYGGFGLSR